MTCDLCQNQASIHLTQLVEGKMQKVNLCKSCSDEKGVDDPTGFELTDMLEGMGEETVTNAVPGETYCHSCGFTQSDFKKTGRFGCASCYQVFNDGLESLLEAMHRHTRHTGKEPIHFAELRKEIDEAAGLAAASGFEPELSGPNTEIPSEADDDDDDDFIDEATLAAIAELDFSEEDDEEVEGGDEVESVKENPFKDLPDLDSLDFDEPTEEPAELTREEKLEELKRDLDAAIKKEDYEACADLRDQINALEAS